MAARPSTRRRSPARTGTRPPRRDAQRLDRPASRLPTAARCSPGDGRREGRGSRRRRGDHESVPAVRAGRPSRPEPRPRCPPVPRRRRDGSSCARLPGRPPGTGALRAPCSRRSRWSRRRPMTWRGRRCRRRPVRASRRSGQHVPRWTRPTLRCPAPCRRCRRAPARERSASRAPTRGRSTPTAHRVAPASAGRCSRRPGPASARRPHPGAGRRLGARARHPLSWRSPTSRRCRADPSR